MTARLGLRVPDLISPFSSILVIFWIFCSLQYYPGASARVFPVQQQQQHVLSFHDAVEDTVPPLSSIRIGTIRDLPTTLDTLLDAMDVMQSRYFDVGIGIWPAANDWIAAILGTHVSATLSTLISSIDFTSPTTYAETLVWDNLINRYFSHTSIFYFGENALSLRQQANDDMLWVVLGWLENIKLIDLYSSIRSDLASTGGEKPPSESWYGRQFKPSAAHRAHIFYDLASRGWDTSLCDGGMVWNPHLQPYKNSITNELFISASMGMYLYFPGDDNDSPFLTSSRSGANRSSSITHSHLHNTTYLHNAITAYSWLQDSNMINPTGLYADGFHVSGWHRNRTGQVDPGTGQCDDLNTMVYTYNQGVVLTGLRGLWLATGLKRYLDDGHDLVESVVAATGWPETESVDWMGLGRGGVLEEYCDSGGYCNQDGQAFKGIFFHHLAEFCRHLSVVEERLLADLRHGGDNNTTTAAGGGFDQPFWEDHLHRCARYHGWLAHNVHAAARTRDPDGRFGMWWGRSYHLRDNTEESAALSPPPLPSGALDYVNDESLTEDGSVVPPASRGRMSGGGSDVGKVTASVVSAGREDPNERGRGRTVETQSGGVAVLRALWQWEGVAQRKKGSNINYEMG